MHPFLVKRATAILAGGLLLASAVIAPAQTDIFLKIEDKSAPPIVGESADKAHVGQIEVFAFSWGEANPATISTGAGSTRAGKVTVSDLTLTKPVDKASATLMQACALGQRYEKATIELVKPGQKPVVYMTYELKNVLISSYNTSTSEGETKGTDNVSITFEAIRITYKTFKPDGTADRDIIGQWNVATNTATFPSGTAAPEAPVASGVKVSVKQGAGKTQE